jgi:RimJ/RimL family protein N-acetyltransferase
MTGIRAALEPLRAEFATELAPVLADPLLHTFIGGHPLTKDELRALYQRQIGGRNADGSQRWLNWLVRDVRAGAAVGTVQATVSMEPDGLTAEVAWVIGTRYQGQGYATEAAQLLTDWLRDQNVDVVIAHIHPEHHSSMAVARAIGLTPTDVAVDGETRWQSRPTGHQDTQRME